MVESALQFLQLGINLRVIIVNHCEWGLDVDHQRFP